MCLILFAWKSVPGTPLVVAANRDEWFARPAMPAAFWPDNPSILAGRDVQAGGTWLGVTHRGRFAALTNYRSPEQKRGEAPSRGELVAAFLSGSESAEGFVHNLHSRAAAYNGFSLLACDGARMFFYSNYGEGPAEIAPGVHGLANHLLDTPWPKVVKGRDGLSRLITQPFSPEPYLALMDDSVPAEEREQPAAGTNDEFERRLSSLRILAGDYGTRCTSVLRFTDAGIGEFSERTYHRDGAAVGEVHHRFMLAK
jgi:uncharacterized protein with NRDE domain